MTALHTYFYIVVDTQRGCHTLKPKPYLTGTFHADYTVDFSPLISNQNTRYSPYADVLAVWESNL